MITKPWGERISAAKQRKLFGVIPFPRFTLSDRDDAGNINRCAVAEAEQRFGVKKDEVLTELGAQFGGAVLLNRVEKAARIQEAIENWAMEMDLRRAMHNPAGTSEKPPAELIPA